MRLWLGIVTFVAGAVLWFVTGTASGRAMGRYAPWVPRLGLALAALGLSVLGSTRTGISWDISSICFSVIAIVLLVWVIRDNFKR